MKSTILPYASGRRPRVRKSAKKFLRESFLPQNSRYTLHCAIIHSTRNVKKFAVLYARAHLLLHERMRMAAKP